MSKAAAVQPLQDLLESVIGRIEALEAASGIQPTSSSGTPSKKSVSTPATAANVADDSPAVKAYDKHVESTVVPLATACKELGELEPLGDHLKDAWQGIRVIVVLATRAKLPQGNLARELQSHLKPVQTAIEKIRKLRLDRKFDWHLKAVIEMATCLSWILVKPPPQTPAAFCKEAIASCEFWSNRIRKEYKGKDDKQIAFCDALKAVGNDLVAYINEYHKTGLTFNPRGVSLAEASVTLEDSPKEKMGITASPRRKLSAGVSGGAGGMSSLISELQKKQTADGSSAATGLRKVTRDQQTWRKEYKGEKTSTVPDIPKLDHNKVTPKQKSQKKLRGLPICEYQERGHKWVVEHQTKESADDGVLTIDISDPKQQVYMFNCEDVTVQVQGKLKSIIMDKCRRVSVVFDSCISSCEMVNSEKIQCQTTGVCPTFSIDKTSGCLIYMSKESMPVTSFITSQSSEMNVSFPDGDAHKEVPIPEQFVHKIVEGSLTSEVSDLYH